MQNPRQDAYLIHPVYSIHKSTISNNATFKEDTAALKANAKYWRSKMIGSRRLDKKRLAFASSGTDYTLHALHTYVSDQCKKITLAFTTQVFFIYIEPITRTELDNNIFSKSDSYYSRQSQQKPTFLSKIDTYAALYTYYIVPLSKICMKNQSFYFCHFAYHFSSIRLN